jgi:hypothetical protein
MKSPTRITNNTSSLTDVMITKNFNSEKTKEILDWGVSDHLVQILHIKADKLRTGPVTVRKKKFTEKSTEEYKYLIHNEAWEYTFLHADANISLIALMSMFIYCFKRAFPLKNSLCEGSM